MFSSKSLLVLPPVLCLLTACMCLPFSNRFVALLVPPKKAAEHSLLPPSTPASLLSSLTSFFLPAPWYGLGVVAWGVKLAGVAPLSVGRHNSKSAGKERYRAEFQVGVLLTCLYHVGTTETLVSTQEKVNSSEITQVSSVRPLTSPRTTLHRHCSFTGKDNGLG